MKRFNLNESIARNVNAVLNEVNTSAAGKTIGKAARTASRTPSKIVTGAAKKIGGNVAGNRQLYIAATNRINAAVKKGLTKTELDTFQKCMKTWRSSGGITGAANKVDMQSLVGKTISKQEYNTFLKAQKKLFNQEIKKGTAKLGSNELMSMSDSFSDVVTRHDLINKTVAIAGGAGVAIGAAAGLAGGTAIGNGEDSNGEDPNGEDSNGEDPNGGNGHDPNDPRLPFLDNPPQVEIPPYNGGGNGGGGTTPVTPGPQPQPEPQPEEPQREREPLNPITPSPAITSNPGAVTRDTSGDKLAQQAKERFNQQAANNRAMLTQKPSISRAVANDIQNGATTPSSKTNKKVAKNFGRNQKIAGRNGMDVGDLAYGK